MDKKKLLITILISFFFVILIDTIAYHLGADINYDLLNYHFYNGYAFLHGRLISDSLQTVQSYLDPFLNSFYYLLISNLSPLFVNLIIASMQSIGVILVFFLSLNLFNDVKFKYLISFLIALSSIFGPIFMSEIGGTMGDTLLAFLVVLSLFLIIKAINAILDEKGLKNVLIYVAFSGIAIGFASGLKLTNMVYMIGLLISFVVILILIDKIKFKTKLILFAVLGFSMFLAFLLVYAPIGIMLYSNFKNPTFPYYNNIFKSPYFPPIAWKDLRWIPTSLIQYLEMPFLLCARDVTWQATAKHCIGMEIPFKTFFFAAIAVLFPFYTVNEFKKYKSKKISYPKLILVLFFIISYVVWLIVFAYYRYIAALEMIAPLILFLMINSFYKKQYFFIFSAFFVLILSLLSYPYSQWGRIKPFPKSYFGVSKKTFDKFSNSLIVVGNMPLGYVLPYFPSNDKIMAIPVRMPLANNFLKNYYNQAAKWSKSMYYLSIIDLPSIAKTINLVQRNKLMLNYNACDKINTYVGGVYLCKLEKVDNINHEIIDSKIIPKLIKEHNNMLNNMYLKPFTTLFSSSRKFIENNNNLSNLYPQYLEEKGYLDKSFGYQTGSAINWTQNNGWIGQWSCPDGKGKCFGVGMVGNIDTLKPIIEKYKPQALQIFFPYPKVYKENSKETNGQLLMIFRAPMQKITSLPFTIDFTSKGNASAFENKGFCNAEDWGTWSCTKAISLNFTIKNTLQSLLYMNVEFNALASSKHPQTFEFYLNGHLLATKQFTTNTVHNLYFDISKYAQKENTMLIKIPDAATPQSLGINSDTRLLGIGLMKINFTNKVPVQPKNTAQKASIS